MKKSQWILYLVFFVLAPSIATAVIYYVSPSGNDKNSGTISSPKRNPYSLKNVLRPGDTVNIRGGRYSSGQCYYGAGLFQGTSSAHITFRGYSGIPQISGYGFYGSVFAPGNYYDFKNLDITPSCTGKNCAYNAFSCTACEGVTIDNVILRHGGINLTGSRFKPVSKFTVKNSYGYNIGSSGLAGEGGGAFVAFKYVVDSVVANNVVFGSGHAAVDVLHMVYSTASGKNTSHPSARNKIVNNYFNQQRFDNYSGGGGGVYLSQNANNNLVEGNAIIGAGNHPKITQNKAAVIITGKNNIVRNNYIPIYGNPASPDSHRALYLATYGTNPSTIGNIINNNYIGAGYGWPMYIREMGGRNNGYIIADNVIKNNTFVKPLNYTKGSMVVAGTINSYYMIYIHLLNGHWPDFANNNTFQNNVFLNHSSAVINKSTRNVKIVYLTDAGYTWTKTLEEVYTQYPNVFFDKKLDTPCTNQFIYNITYIK